LKPAYFPIERIVMPRLATSLLKLGSPQRLSVIEQLAHQTRRVDGNYKAGKIPRLADQGKGSADPYACE
jgi:hypothetical protein